MRWPETLEMMDVTYPFCRSLLPIERYWQTIISSLKNTEKIPFHFSEFQEILLKLKWNREFMKNCRKLQRTYEAPLVMSRKQDFVRFKTRTKSCVYYSKWSFAGPIQFFCNSLSGDLVWFSLEKQSKHDFQFLKPDSIWVKICSKKLTLF